MKTASAALLAHYAGGSTTISRQARIQRKDGFVLRGTTCARDLLINGELYLSKYGTNPMAIEQQSGAAVNNSELDGILSDLVTEADLYAGLWDSAQVVMFEVNYRDLTMGTILIGTGTLGQVSAGRSAFKAEFRSLAQALQQQVGELYQASCSATLGDSRCKFNVEALRVTGTITGVDSTIGRRKFTDTSRTEYQDYFANGVIKWLTGANAGLQEEIAAFFGGVIALKLPMAYNVAVGDTYSVIPGCNKLLKVNQVKYGAVQLAIGPTIYDTTRTEAPGAYIGGSLTFTSGANSGGTFAVLGNFVGSVVLTTTPTNAISIFDGYLISPPASQTFLGDCKVKFNNVVNFRGAPRVPSADNILGLGGMPSTNI